MLKLLKLLFVAIVVLVLFAPMGGQKVYAQTGNIEGEVKGYDGQPLVGVLITLDRKEIKQHFQVKTDKKGRYFHAGLPVGFYRVGVQQDGKEIWYLDNIKVPLQDTARADVNLKAEQEKAKSQPPVLTEEQKKVLAQQEQEKQKHEDMKGVFEQGRALAAEKKYDEAVEAFKKAAEMDPNQHVIFSNMAESYKQLKKYDEALENYNKALAILANKPNPDIEASYHMNMGIIHGLAGKMDNAQAEMKKSAELSPLNASKAYYNLGAMLTNTGKYAEAVEAFKQSVAADPKNADAQYQLGTGLVGMATTTPDGKVVPAPGTIEAFQKYLELAPDGKYAQAAKDMIAALSTSVQTKYGTERSEKKKK
jgi:tetratricopeptide (TPR) repeat protein